MTGVTAADAGPGSAAPPPDASSAPPVDTGGAQSSAVTGQPETPWHESIITKGEDGTETLVGFADWKDKAPAPLRDFITQNMTAARAKTEGMVKAPTSESAPEEWDAFYKAAGRPDTPEGYGFKAPETMPEGVAWDQPLAEKFAAVAHKIGLTPAQAAALSEFQIQGIAEAHRANQAAYQESLAKEKETLGKYFPGENGLSDAAMIAQAAAGKMGIKAAAMDPSSPEFWGPEPMKALVTLARENARLKGESTSTGITAVSQTGRGPDWAHDVMTNPKNPDYSKYRGAGADPKFQAEVNAALAAAPPGWQARG